jgi:carotenoid 1,2-hydratase
MPSQYDRNASPRGHDAEDASGADGRPDATRLRASLPGDGRCAVRPGLARLAGLVQPAGGGNAHPGSLSGRRQRASGSGRADGGNVGPNRSATPHRGPDFAASVATNGYAWWYIDALSDDGQHGLTIIGFVGSVFSPYYGFARRSRPTDPEDYVAINVALYGRTRRWAMTERGRLALKRDTAHLQVGPSAMSWHNGELIIDIDEIAVPLPSRIKGRVRLIPETRVEQTFAIDAMGHHLWHPIAPRTRIEVHFSRPALLWRGHGYFDHNIGSEPLEQAFRCWDWSRASTPDGSFIIYDALPRRPGDLRTTLGLAISKTGTIEYSPLPPRRDLGATLWRVTRATRCDVGAPSQVIRTLEDTPFYARSLIQTHVAGQRLSAFHESLDLDRFKRPVVQAMLPFRMPRRAH